MESNRADKTQGRKQWLTPAQQVAHLKSKGVRFNLMSEKEAISYLVSNNNYFRLRSYRTGFPKVTEGKRKGEYVNLDFKMLVDLSIIDMLLRKTLLPLAIDVEHFAKMSLLSRIEKAGEDGYAVVSDFISSNEKIKKDIDRGKSSVYVAGLLERYPSYDFPAWVFIEVISFGVFCQFYKFCANRFDDGAMLSRYHLLMDIKSFRNACAHNNCVLNDLSTDGEGGRARPEVTQALGRIGGIGSSQRRRKMRNVRLRQIVAVLFVHDELASAGVKGYAAESLSVFVKRMNKHIDYYKGADAVSSTFSFLTKVVENWYPHTEEVCASLETDSSSV